MLQHHQSVQGYTERERKREMGERKGVLTLVMVAVSVEEARSPAERSRLIVCGPQHQHQGCR